MAHDLAACGFPLPSSSEKFTSRFDRCYLAGHAASAGLFLAVRDTGGLESACLPNKNHPSDHLPIVVVMEI